MKLTKRQREIRDKYTEVCKIDGTHYVQLNIDHQSFATTDLGKYKTNAEWYRKMLAIALTRMIENER